MKLSPGRAFALFAVTSGIAVLVGCIVVAVSEDSEAAWARNAWVWAAGALISFVMARAATQRMAWGCLLLTPAVMVATLFSSGPSGVHRWVVLGPFWLNAAELLLPMTVVAWAEAVARRSPLWASVSVIGVILALQPDASQAVALAGAVIAVLLTVPSSNVFRLLVAVVPVAAAMVAIFRPDLLQPVPEVEGIIGLALETSPALAVLAVLALAGAVLSPLAAVAGSRAAAVGLTVYFALSALAPCLGAFPVPLVGMGVSPILGAWFGMGLLAAGLRDRAVSPISASHAA
ncbi:hypothetical protein JY651_46205 [Pyxidicoccus parkwayensis]|uniref:Uncharacterized protein n=1 Tax=Pyxidicoccus parkwayensis TaxID=2813578 RepID=A0ABX7NYB6_9BACT|nr:hypothetical protein [Pyxidicoccus parkwaysis]QSQ22435.1 hypothetical protein JY651_46205 [Pyxidicoccus parkwaysis]